MTDAPETDAMPLPLPEAAVAVIAAGVDVVIFTSSWATSDVISALEPAVGSGRLSDVRVDEAAGRVLRTPSSRGSGCAL